MYPSEPMTQHTRPSSLTAGLLSIFLVSHESLSHDARLGTVLLPQYHSHRKGDVSLPAPPQPSSFGRDAVVLDASMQR